MPNDRTLLYNRYDHSYMKMSSVVLVKTGIFQYCHEINRLDALHVIVSMCFCQLTSEETVVPRSLNYWTLSTVLAGEPELQDRR